MQKNEEEKNRFKEISVSLLKSKEYKYVLKFANSYKKHYKCFMEGEEYNDKKIEKKIIKLKKYLDSKGFNFSIAELKSLIYNEIVIQTYEEFKSKIFKYNPQNFKEYIKTFLKIFGEDYKEFINYYHFKILLSEKGIEYTEYTLKDEIMDVKRDLAL